MDQPDGLGNIILLDIIKICVTKLMNVVIIDQWKDDCEGCQIHHPSQIEHRCLYPIPEYYVFTRFKQLMNKIWTGQFIPGIMWVLETQGIVTMPSRVHGICEAILYDLRNVKNIMKKIGNDMNIDHVLGGYMKKDDLLNEFVQFWSNSSPAASQ